LAESPSITHQSLTDEIEISMVSILQDNPGLSIKEIDRLLCHTFPGFATPSKRIIEIILSSYGNCRYGEDHGWYINPEDYIESSKKETFNYLEILQTLGKKLICDVFKGETIRWSSQNLDYDYIFYITNTAALTRQLYQIPVENHQINVLLLPERRFDLFNEKLKEDFRLRKTFQEKWHLLGFEELKYLHTRMSISLENFNTYLTTEIESRSQSLQLDLFGE